MFYIYLIAAFLNVLLLGVAPVLGLPLWLPIASGALCGLGAWRNRGKTRPAGKPRF